MRLVAPLVACALAVALAPGGLGQAYYPDDPLWQDPDRLDAPAPEPRDLSDYYDFIENELGRPGEGGPALNVNTLSEVPNSSWYRNPAFHFMDADEAFWAARQVAHFMDEELRAVIGAAEYPDPEAARIVSEALVGRRDAIAEAYLRHGGGVDRFRVEDGRLAFDNLLALHALAPGTSAALPDVPGAFMVAAIETPLGTTTVTLRREPGGWVPVGVKRLAGTTDS